MAWARGSTGRSGGGIGATVRTLVLLWLAGVTLRSTILALPPVLPQITADLGLDGSDIGLLTALPSLLFALAAIPGALLIARLGALPTLIVGLALNALGAAARGFAGSPPTLDLTTFVMCLGIAVMQPALPRLVRAWSPGRVGFATAVYTNGLLVGEVLPTAWIPQPNLPVIGGGWRATLALWAVPVLVTASLFAMLARRPKPSSNQAPARWWPDWRDRRIWRLGLLLGSINALYFSLNGFLPGWMTANRAPHLVQPILITLNLTQIPASLLLIFLADRLIRRPMVYGIGCAVMLASLVGAVAMPGTAALVWAGICGFVLAGMLTLTLALPSLIASADDVPRVSAAMFTISYGLSMICALLGGWLWTQTGTVAAAFMPAGSALVLATAIGFLLKAEELSE